MAAVRSRHRIALNLLVPVMTLSWLMMAIPVSISLISSGITPSVESLRPLLVGIALSVAHATIGFGAGVLVPPLISAPLMAVATFLLVAFSTATTPFWLRHVSGQYREPLMLGELVSFETMFPHLLFTGGIALGVASSWFFIKSTLVKVGLACLLALGGMTSAQRLVHDWGPSDPVLVGNAPMSCVNRAPQVCMPTATKDGLARASTAAQSVLDDLRSAGVNEEPALITDRLADGRYYLPSDSRTWRVNLTSGVRNNNVRYQLVAAAVGFKCERPSPRVSREVMLWAAQVTGEERSYQQQLEARAEQFDTAENQTKVRTQVKKILTLPAQDQGAWFKQRRLDACRSSS
ncbi:DUF7224 domain-containing protein [Streptomyces sp. NPDC054855]